MKNLEVKPLKICVSEIIYIGAEIEIKTKTVYKIDMVFEFVTRFIVKLCQARAPNFLSIKLFPSLELRNVLMVL